MTGSGGCGITPRGDSCAVVSLEKGKCSAFRSEYEGRVSVRSLYLQKGGLVGRLEKRKGYICTEIRHQPMNPQSESCSLLDFVPPPDPIFQNNSSQQLYHTKQPEKPSRTRSLTHVQYFQQSKG